ncbi:MAG TPA: hypothetical protein VIJ68_03545 [Candidatus Saccharimonadales bacterium]
MTHHHPDKSPVTLEPFPVFERLAAQAAPLVSQFAEDEREWLERLYPDIVSNYALPYDALNTMLNLAKSEQSRTYTIYGRNNHLVVLGLARVVLDQNIIHPELDHPIEGDRMGWVLRATAGAEIHATVAAKLHEKQGDRPAFSLVDTDDPQSQKKAVALDSFMIAVGGPATLTTTTVRDPFESAPHDGPKQIYQFVPSAS